MAIIFATALFASGQSKNAKAETRIRQIVADQVAAWNIGDENAFSASFAEDGSFTNIRGTVFYGHTALVDRHREMFQGFFKGSKLSMTVSKIRFVRPISRSPTLALTSANYMARRWASNPPPTAEFARVYKKFSLKKRDAGS